MKNKIKITNQHLFIFLYERGAWEKFENNLNDLYNANKKIKEINELGKNIAYAIDIAFPWSESPEGYTYWAVLSNAAYTTMKK